MTVIMYLCAALSLVFSATCFVPSFGVAFWGFPLTLLFSGFSLFVMLRFLKSPDRKRFVLLHKLLEYLPFVLFAGFVFRRSGATDGSFVFDLVSVILWIAVSILDIVILFRLSEKRVKKDFPSLPDAPAAKKSVAIQGLEWVDALVQAACLVLLIELFIFQLYAIPSESMVPEFMIGDRVFVLKTPSGPKFPLSDVGIPRMRDYKRGDIVVFSNPHFNDTKESRVRSFASQLVYMLTFTGVNINRDEFGEVKADPLVKRVTGVPGEKLMLVDGVLYNKHSGETGFKPVSEDASWAAWDLASLPLSEKALVKVVPLSADEFNLLQSVESTRANVDTAALAAEARALVKRFAAIKPTADTVTTTPDLFPKARREIVAMFQSNGDITRLLLTTNGGLAWFSDFMTAWIDLPARANLYDERSFDIDLLMKMDFGRLIVRNAELFAANSTADQFRRRRAA